MEARVAPVHRASTPHCDRRRPRALDWTSDGPSRAYSEPFTISRCSELLGLRRRRSNPWCSMGSCRLLRGPVRAAAPIRVSAEVGRHAVRRRRVRAAQPQRDSKLGPDHDGRIRPYGMRRRSHCQLRYTNGHVQDNHRRIPHRGVWFVRRARCYRGVPRRCSIPGRPTLLHRSCSCASHVDR